MLSANLLVTDSWVVKVVRALAVPPYFITLGQADFGTARVNKALKSGPVQSFDSREMTAGVGTLLWCSPEVHSTRRHLTHHTSRFLKVPHTVKKRTYIALASCFGKYLPGNYRMSTSRLPLRSVLSLLTAAALRYHRRCRLCTRT